MSFTTELQDLKSKIEALIAAGGTIEPALINQLAYINQALDQGGGGGGTTPADIGSGIDLSADIEAIKTSLAALQLEQKKAVVDVGMSVAIRPADTTDYAAGDAFGTGSNVQVEDDLGDGITGAILVTCWLDSADPVAGDLALILDENPLPATTDNAAPGSSSGNTYQIVFPKTNWIGAFGRYKNEVPVLTTFEFYPPQYRVYGQLIALEAFTPVASQTINAVMHFVET